jgi:Fe-S-cluster containining protein
MTNNMNAGRNEPCPCGSGKKFKKCHGDPEFAKKAERSRFELSREIAYLGTTGKARREFCEALIARKQATFKDIEKKQKSMAEAKGETISCGKGCAYCCNQYVDASLQETEAIVYYLYQNEEALNHFLKVYPEWRERVRKAGDSFEKVQYAWEKEPGGWRVKKSVEGGIAALYEYTVAKIPCPFLVDNACSIYPVRPYACAGVFATTPPEWCDALTQSKAKIYTALEPDIVDDTSFYFNKLEQPLQSLMPVTVYHFLIYGLIGMPEIPGIVDLPTQVLNDPEVKAVVERHIKASNL